MTEATADAGGRSYGASAYRTYVLLVLTLVYTINFVDRYLLSVLAQPVIEAFDLSDSEYGFLNGPPFAIFYALMGIPIAALADRYNRVVIISICIAIWSLMAALCGFATSFLFLLFARIGVAIGEAGCTPPANSIIGDYFKPRSRANALGIYAMGVTLGAALSNAFGGPIATGLNGETLLAFFQEQRWLWAVDTLDWRNVEGWRIAFVLIGAPGLLVALLVLFTVKEPPRGYSDPPGAPTKERANFYETLREVSRKPTFWTLTIAAALTALAGYGLTGFQAPMAQRIHGISPGEFALQFGVPLSLCAALGTFLGGYLIGQLTPWSATIVSWAPAVGLLISVPLYLAAFFLPTEDLGTARVLWCVGAMFQYSYLSSQYAIAQGVVSARARASSVAILLLVIALIGNGLGPQIVGWLSDMFMGMQLADHGVAGVLSNELCRSGAASLPADQAAICATAYGEGLRWAMASTTLFFVIAAIFFLASATTLKKDLVAKPV
ncbi:MAG: MFS transporter [Hyphomonadaceae bacterium]|nr:MFS transporter [Hyphomonadaceae bacterium]